MNIDNEIDAILARMPTQRQQAPNMIGVQMADMAQLLTLLAKKEADSAKKLEHYTVTLVRLQWALIWLTVGLFVFTVYLAVFH